MIPRRNAALPAVGALAVLLLIGGCAAPPCSDDGAASAAWRAHQDRLAPLTRWRMTGRVAVRTADDGWSAAIDWLQHADDAWTIEFRGPFGQGAAAVRAAGGVVTMELPGRPLAAATDAETLLARELGWTVPVSGLRYWIRGVPAPDAVADAELDSDGRLRVLRQSGWRAEYQRYTFVAGTALPAKMTLTRDALRLRFVIDAWHIDAQEPPHDAG